MYNLYRVCFIVIIFIIYLIFAIFEHWRIQPKVDRLQFFFCVIFAIVEALMFVYVLQAFLS